MYSYHYCHSHTMYGYVNTLLQRLISEWGTPYRGMAISWAQNGGFQSHGGTPVHHPFFFEIFHEINHPSIGVPTFMKTPISSRGIPNDGGMTIANPT